MDNYRPNCYEFRMESYDGTVLTRTFQKESLGDILEEFEYFLKGCGFHIEGTLDFIQDDVGESVELPTVEPLGEDLNTKSKWYFDRDRNR